MENIENAVQEIIENAADWGWELETEQDCSDAAYSYCLDSSGDPTGWEELSKGLAAAVNA